MDEQVEIWKDIPGWEGYYQVSNMGRVKSLSRITHRLGTPVRLNDRILAIRINGRGYVTVILYKDGMKKSARTHSLVCLAFLGYNRVGNNFDINHIDGNPLNNKLSNLEIVTHRDNCSICFRKNKENITSKYVGVSWSKEKRKWVAQIGINGKQTPLGRYDTEEDASIAYQDALLLIKNKGNGQIHKRNIRPNHRAGSLGW